MPKFIPKREWPDLFTAWASNMDVPAGDEAVQTYQAAAADWEAMRTEAAAADEAGWHRGILKAIELSQPANDDTEETAAAKAALAVALACIEYSPE